MKILKVLAALLCALTLCFILAACVHSGGVEPTSDAAQTASDHTAAPEDVHDTAAPSCEPLRFEDVYDPFTDWDNGKGRSYATFAESDEAYYFSALGDYCYYYDKIAGERGVLCGKPECMHDAERANSGCNGFIQCHAGWLCFYKEHIYYVGSDEKDLCVYRLNTDGSGREKLTIIEYDEQHIPEEFYFHRGRVYANGRGYKVSCGVPYYTWYVMCWDIETGEFKLIYENSSVFDQARPLLFFFGDDVYFCASYYLSEDDVTPQIDLFRWSSLTGELETLYSGQDPNVIGGEFSLWVAAEDEIYSAPIFALRETDAAAVYRLTDGRLEKRFEFTQKGQIRLLDGAAVLTEFFGMRQKPYVEMRDYSGELLFTGELDMGFLNEVAEEEGKQVDRFTCYSTLGDSKALYYVIKVTFEDDTSRTCLVRYEAADDGLIETLLCVDKYY